MRSLIVLFILFNISSLISSQKYQCVDPDGNNVDWYAIYMFANKTASDDKIHWAYYDSNSQGSFRFMKYDDTNFPPLTMTAGLNFNDDSYNYFIWNDEEAGEKSYSYKVAHSKGALAYDSNSGWFISHSLPKFPYILYSGDGCASFLPYNVGYYTQHYFCMTLTTESAINLVGQLNVIYPKFLAAVSQDNVQSPPNPIVTQAISNQYQSSPQSTQINITTLGGVTLTNFAKNRDFDELPWDHAIPEMYNDSFYVETWILPERLPPVCSSQFNIYNVVNMTYGAFTFDDTNEHAKWGAGVNSGAMCFGDLNRVASQRERGGLITCFVQPELNNLFVQGITNYDGCNSEFLN